MLTQNNINVVKPFAEMLSDKGLTIMPNGDHELAVLNRFAMSTKETVVHDAQALVSFIDSIPTTSDNGEHHAALLNFSDQIAKLASAHMSHCSGVVTPKTVEFAKKLSEYQNVILKADDPVKQFEVKSFSVPAITSNDLFEGAIKNKNVKVKPTRLFPVKPASPEEVLVFLNFPNKTLNTLIGEWWISTDGYAKHAYDCFFGSGPTEKCKELSLVDIENQTDIERLHIGILFVLMGTMYQTSLPDTTSGTNTMNLNTWNSLCKDYVEYGAHLVSHSLRLIETAVSAQRVIMEVTKLPMQEGAVVIVLEPVYSDWLEHGGSPEVLFGSVVSDNTTYNGKFLSDNSERYRREWASFSSLCSARFEKGRAAHIATFIEQAGLDAIADISATEKDTFYKSDTYRQGAQARLKKLMSSLKVADYNKVYDVAIEVVGGCGYFNTAACSIMKVMHDLGEKNPNMAGADAANIAYLDYVCGFLTTLVTVKKT